MPDNTRTKRTRRGRRRVRVGYRSVKRWGPFRAYFTHRGLSSVSLDTGIVSVNSRTGDATIDGPLGAWAKVDTGLRLHDGGAFNWRRLLSVLSRALRWLLIAGIVLVLVGAVLWRIYGDDVRRAACDRASIACPTTEPAPAGGDR